MNEEDERLKHQCLGSLLFFTKIFYKLRTGRDFEISKPVGRESHHITISRALTKIYRWPGNKKNLVINVAPRLGKTELLIHFVAWTMAKHPDSNYIYVSYSHTLAKKQTQTIKEIMSLPAYRKLFGVEIKDDVSAKDNFETTAGGSVYAVGSGGTITGRGAGIQGKNGWGGGVVCDDLHKPAEVSSETMRTSVNNWYDNTLQSRLNSPTTPIIFIGQRLHEDDIAAKLLARDDFESVILKSLDDAGNALHPSLHSKEYLLKLKEESPYEFASQYQQDPIPAGGGLFATDDFPLLDFTPKILATFITADTAETDKTWNDKTVFSFWGLHKITAFGEELDLYGLHLLDCAELQIEPKDLEPEFMQFVSQAMRFHVKPQCMAIEKKSTGTTLLSVLKNIPGIRLLPIERTKASGSKTTRFLEMQPYIKKKLVSLPANAKFKETYLTHMSKITANDSHRFDDICDSSYDAIKIALIDKLLIMVNERPNEEAPVLDGLINQLHRRSDLKRKAYYGTDNR